MFAHTFSLSINFVKSAKFAYSIVFFTIWQLATVSLASSPQVAFDMPPMAACRDVTTPEFTADFPNEKLIEARFEISALIRGEEENLLQFFYRMESQRQSMRVADFLPKTTLASNYAGNISIENKDEKSNHLGVAFTAPLDWPLKATSSGDIGSKQLHGIRYELVPPMEAIAASGTLQRGFGVYFKLRPSRSTSLEGAKEFVVVFRVPRSWRGDLVHVDCRAMGLQRGVITPLDERVVAGHERFVIALFTAGDLAAQRAAEEFVRAENRLLEIAASKQREIEQRSFPTFAHRVGKFFDVVEPKVPAAWTRQVIYGDSELELREIERYLPAPVRNAASAFVAAKRNLSEMRFE